MANLDDFPIKVICMKFNDAVEMMKCKSGYLSVLPCLSDSGMEKLFRLKSLETLHQIEILADLLLEGKRLFIWNNQFFTELLEDDFEWLESSLNI
jgi:hypothetical protein